MGGRKMRSETREKVFCARLVCTAHSSFSPPMRIKIHNKSKFYLQNLLLSHMANVAFCRSLKLPLSDNKPQPQHHRHQIRRTPSLSLYRCHIPGKASIFHSDNNARAKARPRLRITCQAIDLQQSKEGSDIEFSITAGQDRLLKGLARAASRRKSVRPISPKGKTLAAAQRPAAQQEARGQVVGQAGAAMPSRRELRKRPAARKLPEGPAQKRRREEIETEGESESASLSSGSDSASDPRFRCSPIEMAVASEDDTDVGDFSD